MSNFAIRVFISYSHDSEEHADRVLNLAQQLRDDGIDAWIDQFENGQPKEGWPRWMEHQLDIASRILVVCTSTYFRRFMHAEEPGAGLGVRWESNLLRSALYNSANISGRILPVLFDGASIEEVPAPLRFHSSCFHIMGDYEKLLRLLTDQPLVSPKEVGNQPVLADADSSAEFSRNLRSRMAEFNRQVERLTNEQYRVIRLLSNTRKVRIAGCAGSGKTLVAAEKAIRLSEGAGLRVLFLCHSPLLATYVTSLVRGTGVVVWTFGDWVRHLARLPEEEEEGPWIHYDEPYTDAIEAAFDVLSKHGGNFDAVVVDEGQDFRSEWWVIVEGALADGSAGILYIFHDDHQALLPHRGTYPIDDPVLDLSRNCRNSGKIFDLVRYFHAQAPDPDLLEEGQVVVFNAAVGDELSGLRQALTLAHQQGLTEDEIIVLLSGGLRVADWPGIDQSLEISQSLPWQPAILRYFLRAAETYDRRGITFPEQATRLIKEELSGLSEDPFPTQADIDLVCDLARTFHVSARVRRRVLNKWEPANFLQFRVQNEKLRLRRRRSGARVAAEIFMHFENENWADTLPMPIEKVLTVGENTVRGRGVRVFDLNAFKGLEADTIVLLAGGYRPLRTEETYVGISRARFSLFIVDCGAGLSLPAELLP